MDEAVKKIVITTYDKKAHRYGELYCFNSKEEAIRAFGDGISQSGSQMNRHPEDYQLVHLADFDFVHGVVVGSSERVVLADGFDFRKE